MPQIRTFNCVGWELNTPPGSPAFGAWYYTGDTPTGAWAGHPLVLTLYEFTGAWTFEPFVLGDQLYSQPLEASYVWDGTELVRSSAGSAFSAQLAADYTINPTTYADVDDWEVADEIDAGAFTWDEATGELTVLRKIKKARVEGTFRIDSTAVLGTAVPNSVLIKLQVDSGGGYADVSGTIVGGTVDSKTTTTRTTVHLHTVITVEAGSILKIRAAQDVGADDCEIMADGTTLVVTEIL